MSNLAIIKVTKKPLVRHKVHGGEIKGEGIRPVCGGGRLGRTTKAWNQDFEGVRALTCKRCLKILSNRVKRLKQRGCE